MIPELARLDEPFQFHEKLRAGPALYVEPDFVAFVLQAVPAIHVDDLIHFVMGIFWKASIHPWREGRNKPSLELGPRGDDVRKFLLNESAFPGEMALSITVLPPPVTLVAFHFPYATRGPDATFHLYVSGLDCTLWVGPNIPPQIAAGSIHRPPHHLLIVDNAEAIKRKYRRALESVAKRKLKRGRRRNPLSQAFQKHHS